MVSIDNFAKRACAPAWTSRSDWQS